VTIRQRLKSLDHRIVAIINGNPTLYYLALFVGMVIVFLPFYLFANLRNVVAWIASLFH